MPSNTDKTNTDNTYLLISTIAQNYAVQNSDADQDTEHNTTLVPSPLGLVGSINGDQPLAPQPDANEENEPCGPNLAKRYYDCSRSNIGISLAAIPCLFSTGVGITGIADNFVPNAAISESIMRMLFYPTLASSGLFTTHAILFCIANANRPNGYCNPQNEGCCTCDGCGCTSCCYISNPFRC